MQEKKTTRKREKEGKRERRKERERGERMRRCESRRSRAKSRGRRPPGRSGRPVPPQSPVPKDPTTKPRAPPSCPSPLPSPRPVRLAFARLPLLFAPPPPPPLVPPPPPSARYTAFRHRPSDAAPAVARKRGMPRLPAHRSGLHTQPARANPALRHRADAIRPDTPPPPRTRRRAPLIPETCEGSRPRPQLPPHPAPRGLG